MEDILKPNPHRFALFPIKHQDIWNACKDQQSVIWTAEEITLSEDVAHWNKLSDEERHFLSYVLGFFMASDGLLVENIAQRFTSDVQYPEARYFYATQMYMESVHSETYSLLIDTYISDPVEKDFLFNAIDNVPIIKEKGDWVLNWIGSDEDFATRLLAFICVEGVFFCSSFCAIYYICNNGRLPGLDFSNELISRDESLHAQFGILLYNNHVQNKLSEDKVHELFNSAVELESKFVREALPKKMVGMSDDMMIQYVKFIADGLLIDLGYKKIYNVENPFEFMETISLQRKTNFFERRVGQYALANVGSVNENQIVLTEDV